VVGLVVGSYQGCSEGLHALAREVAEESARTEWRQMGARSEHEALGIFVHDVHRRWGSVRVLAVVGARHPRPPARHREAERRDPPPRPAARARARASGRGRGGSCRRSTARPLEVPSLACASTCAAAARSAMAGEEVHFSTNAGDFSVELYSSYAPRTCKNFSELCARALRPAAYRLCPAATVFTD